MTMIGEFEIDPTTIVESPLLPKDQELVFQIKDAARKTAPNSGNTYISFIAEAVDFPGGQIYVSYFLTAKALSDRRSGVSWKKFLDKVGLSYSTQAQDLNNFRFKGVLKHVGQGEEARAELEKVVGAAN